MTESSAVPSGEVGAGDGVPVASPKQTCPHCQVACDHWRLVNQDLVRDMPDQYCPSCGEYIPD